MTVTCAELVQPGDVVMVQAYTYVPGPVTDATAEGSVALGRKVAVPGPDITDHAPVPTTGVLPPRGALMSD